MPAFFTVTEPTPLLPFLFTSHPEVKRTKVRQWLKFGSVIVNDVATTQFDAPLKVGDVVRIKAAKVAREEELLPRGMKIFFEDEHLIVVHKPENLLTIASEAEQDETAYSYLTDYVKRKKDRARERVWIVHRLDRETSGLIVFAKTAEAKDTLQGRWDQVEKRYLAVVQGNMKEEDGVMRCFLDETNPYKVFITPQREDTREAITHYVVKKRGKGRTLVELTLETGRRHQIRVQLAGMKRPIVGDEKYGCNTDPAKRLGLHSYQLKMEHPITGEMLELESPLPLELVRLV